MCDVWTPLRVLIPPGADVAEGFVLPTIMAWGRCFNIRIGGHLFGLDLDVDDDILSDAFQWECVLRKS